jgi:hypothetical protein
MFRVLNFLNFYVIYGHALLRNLTLGPPIFHKKNPEFGWAILSDFEVLALGMSKEYNEFFPK